MITANDRVDLAVPTHENRTHNLKILVRTSISWSRDVEVGSIPPSQQNTFHCQCCCHIFWLLRAPTLLDDPNALCWKVCSSWFLPDIMQARRVSLLARGCGLLFAGCQMRALLECSKLGISINNSNRRLYHGYVGHKGITMIPLPTSKTILCNTSNYRKARKCIEGSIPPWYWKSNNMHSLWVWDMK